MSEIVKKEPIIELRGLTKNFDDQQVLKGIDLSLAKGSFCVLLGPSGSGKSTLLNIIGGIDSADAGEIVIETDEIGTDA